MGEVKKGCQEPGVDVLNWDSQEHRLLFSSADPPLKTYIVVDKHTTER